jgi:hypothetical protein
MRAAASGKIGPNSPRFERLSRSGGCWSPAIFPRRFSFGDECVEILLLHVNGTEFPQFNRPEGKAWVWKKLRREGDVVAAILDAAEEADLSPWPQKASRALYMPCSGA